MSAEQWKVFFDKLSTPFYKQFVFNGLLITLKIAILGFILGVILGTVLALVQVAYNKNVFVKILDKICKVYVALFRGTPMVVQLLLAYYVLIPMLSMSNVNSETVGIIVFGMNSAAYVSEIMRGGINSVDIGQLEAGRALGLSYTTTMIKIVIPQAFKNVLPALINEMIVLLKETAIIGYIGTIDITKAATLVQSRTYDALVPLLSAAIFYLILVMILTYFMGKLERRLRKSDH